MATYQTTLFTGVARPVFGNAFRSGSPITFRHTHIFNQAVLAADVLELFVLPAYARIARFQMISANVGAITATGIGLMTGTPGDTSAVRTVGTELIAAGVLNTSLESTLLQLDTLGKNGDSPVSIGLDPAADISDSATKTITFQVTLF